MEPKEAVAKAKAHFEAAFDETPTLEEIWFEDSQDGGVWCITLGIRRLQATSPLGLQYKETTDYKVVRVRDKDGVLVSIRNRQGERAA
jgi:hypothetical protein